ncbi:MAG: hypothetical protein AB7S78_10530 [Candidatus Omnitrophota bacterium]
MILRPFKFIQSFVLLSFLLISHSAFAADLTVTTNTTLTTGAYTYDDVTVSNNAALTLEGTVRITADNITVSSGSRISADKKGYNANQGPGAGSASVTGGSGGGHGGNGGTTPILSAKGPWYGSATQPFQMGSGGGGAVCGGNQSGGRGGGAIWLDVANTLTVSGTLSANGESVFQCDLRSGGGAGGGIYITTSTLAGSGDIVANGGNGGSLRGGGGGGGRIAVYYESSTFTGSARAIGGHGHTELGESGDGGDGTVGFIDMANNEFIAGHQWRFQLNDSPLEFDTITLDDASVTTTDGTVTISGTQLILDGASSFFLNGEETFNIKDVTVTGTSLIEGNLFLKANNLTITSGSKVSADSKGFKGGMGVGAALENQGQGGGGGGYGGEGGTAQGGIAYGSPTAPVDFGSGGAGPGFTINNVYTPSSGGTGGGKIQLNIADTLTVNGVLSANGGMGLPQGSQSGGGSGGSIYVITENFTGSGVITANGGNSQLVGGSAAGGGGGGGRIAIYHRQNETFTGTTTATGGNGVGEDGDDGTVVQQQTVLAINPDRGGDTGNLTITFSGSVFDEGTHVMLTKSGEDDIEGDFLQILNNGLVLKATFDLAGKAQGDWTIVIINSGNTITSENAFTVEDGAPSGLWMDIIGRTDMRPDREQTYLVTYGNIGNNDITSAELFVGIPDEVDYLIPEFSDSFKNLAEDTVAGFIVANLPVHSSRSFPIRIKSSLSSGNISLNFGSTVIDFGFGDNVTHFEPTNNTLPLPDSLTATNNPSTTLKYANQRYKANEDAPDGILDWFNIYDSEFSSIKPEGEGYIGTRLDDKTYLNLRGVGPVEIPFNDIKDGEVTIDLPGGGTKTIQIEHLYGLRPIRPGEMPALVSRIRENLPVLMANVTFCEWSSNGTGCSIETPYDTSCLGFYSLLTYGKLVNGVVEQREQPWISLCGQTLGKATCGFNEVLKWTELNQLIDKAIVTWELTSGVVSTAWDFWWGANKLAKIIFLVTSRDPNAIVGPQGFGSEKYIAKRQPLQYIIYFENIESASAPAQEVIVSDQLDTTVLDLSTFELGPIGVAEKIINLPSGIQEFITEVDLRPDNDLILRIEVALNTASGDVVWKFISLDPESHMFTDDPNAGFLPPNDNPPEGDGFVTFSVRAKDSVETNDEIINSASIVFDTNSPITTNTWLNTIDDTKPSSSMNSMASTGTLTSFDISWSGSDAHSGIKEYTIYVSENSGPYAETLTTTGTFTSFVGVNGSTYSFYTIATDQVGNREDAPGSPDLTITINDPMQEPCTIKTDYLVGVTCSSTTTVTNDSQLEDYLVDYDYTGTYYRNLTINYNVTMDNIDIHSPCKVTIATGKVLTGERICIDGRTGVANSNGMTINGTFVTLVSETGDTELGSNSTINATELTLQAYKIAQIYSNAQVDVDGPLLIKSLGTSSTNKAHMGQTSTIHAGSVRLEANQEASTGPGMILDVDDELEIISTGTSSNSKALIGISSAITAASLEMSADRQVEIGTESEVTVTEGASMISTGSTSTSDVKINLGAEITADSFDMIGGDDAILSAASEVTVTNNFHMQAATVGDCSISGSATINAGSESGNCL